MSEKKAKKNVNNLKINKKKRYSHGQKWKLLNFWLLESEIIEILKGWYWNNICISNFYISIWKQFRRGRERGRARGRNYQYQYCNKCKKQCLKRWYEKIPYKKCISLKI